MFIIVPSTTTGVWLLLALLSLCCCVGCGLLGATVIIREVESGEAIYSTGVINNETVIY
jgi:hypothetical protein